jgi:response regulator RpfG family c-di-GMP phosphodiesterase
MRTTSQQAIFIDDTFIETIGLASIMHDLGKVTTPDNILQKPAALDDGERTIVQRHAQVGREMLEKASTLAPQSAYFSLGAEIAGSHHERFDGSGYPKGIAGTQIPLSARIVAVADVFDALTHARVYKKAWTREDAIAYIRERSGTQFDPDVVEAFLALDPALITAGIGDE